MKLEPNFRFCIPVLMLLMLMNVLLAFLFSYFLGFGGFVWLLRKLLAFWIFVTAKEYKIEHSLKMGTCFSCFLFCVLVGLFGC